MFSGFQHLISASVMGTLDTILMTQVEQILQTLLQSTPLMESKGLISFVENDIKLLEQMLLN